MRKIWKPIVAVLMGLVFSNMVFFVVDVLVLQIYPLPPGLWGRGTLVEIIATRPDAAVALNLAGGMIATAAAAYLAFRRRRSNSESRNCPHLRDLAHGDRELYSDAQLPMAARHRVCVHSSRGILGRKTRRRGYGDPGLKSLTPWMVIWFAYTS
jgi:hypothetical protein